MASKANKPQDSRKPSGSTLVAKSSIPKPPEDRPHTPVIPDTLTLAQAPKNAEAAAALLESHHYMQRKDAITAELIVCPIGSIARMEGVTPHVAILLTAVTVLLPKAFQNVNAYTAHLYNLRGALEKLSAKTKTILGLVKNLVGTDDQLGDQLTKVIEALGTVSQKAEATKKAIEDTKKTLISFVKQQGMQQERQWSTVNRGNNRSHRESAPTSNHPQAPNPLSGTNTIPISSRPKPTARRTGQELPPDAVQRCCYQAATILVRPKDQLNKNLSRYDAKALTRLAMEATEKAWDLALFAIAFEEEFGEEVTCYSQQADMFVDGVPTTFDPTSGQNIRTLEVDNQLEHRSVLYCSWVKPAEMWAPGQTRAVLWISLRLQDVADKLISSRGRLEGERVTFRRIVEEPLRCMRCQRYGHKANDCCAKQDTCSCCAGGHCSLECPTPNRLACANCHLEEHAAWNRKCEAYLAAWEKFSQLRPENNCPFFNPTRTHAREEVEEITALMESIRIPQLTIGDTLTADGIGRPSTIPGFFSRQHASKPPKDNTVPSGQEELEEEEWSKSDVGKAAISPADLPDSPAVPWATRPSSRSPLETRLKGVFVSKPAPDHLTLSKILPGGARACATSAKPGFAT
ncbi:hypothetical protein RhiJN_24458 [Ceratobasidium sp. AG-Ba]|nr:hypothetical protein RhiJN_24458 [Ceratobasidium sp. AG-Ba]